MGNENQVFREKSLKRVASPEELDDYIKVTNPGIWLLLACVIIFLAGILAWGYFGKLESLMTVYGKSENGSFTGYVTGKKFMELNEGMEVRAEETHGYITALSPYPTPAGEIIPQSSLEKFDFKADTPLYPVSCNLSLPDGVYEASIVLEEIKPLSLIFD